MDQTHFISSQESLQSPPETHIKKPPKPDNKKNKAILLLVVVAVVLTAIAFVVSISSGPQTTTSLQTPKFEKQNSREISELHQQLLDIKSDLDQSDPSQIDLVIPPIDYSIPITLEQQKNL